MSDKDRQSCWPGCRKDGIMSEVGIILGSDSDLPDLSQCFGILEKFGISFEVKVSSAHRTPEATKEWVSSARSRGIRIIIAAAGGAATGGAAAAAAVHSARGCAACRASHSSHRRENGFFVRGRTRAVGLWSRRAADERA